MHCHWNLLLIKCTVTGTSPEPHRNPRNPVDSEAVNFVRALTGGNSTGKITFGTEGGLFQQELGIPAVVCGPGSIAVAHKPDEYVSGEQLALCDAMLGRLLDRLSA